MKPISPFIVESVIPCRKRPSRAGLRLIFDFCRFDFIFLQGCPRIERATFFHVVLEAVFSLRVTGARKRASLASALCLQ